MTLLTTLCVFSLSTLADLLLRTYDHLSNPIKGQFFKILACWLQKQPFEFSLFSFYLNHTQWHIASFPPTQTIIQVQLFSPSSRDICTDIAARSQRTK